MRQSQGTSPSPVGGEQGQALDIFLFIGLFLQLVDIVHELLFGLLGFPPLLSLLVQLFD